MAATAAPEPASALVRTLYRAMLQPLRRLAARGDVLRIRLPVHRSASQWLAGDSQSEMNPPEPVHTIAALFPFLKEPEGLWGGKSVWGDDPGNLKSELACELVRKRFREPAVGQVEERLNEGFAALRALSEQLKLADNTVVTRTTREDGVAVCVECSYHPPGGGKGDYDLWPFQYRIRIRNEGTLPVKLLGREWLICGADGRAHAHVPKGSPGVVGEQPLLLPGQSFEYASGLTLPNPSGSLEGSLQMVVPELQQTKPQSGTSDTPLIFDVRVGPLRLHA